MNIITSTSDLALLLNTPFEQKKIIYSLNSDFFRKNNVLYRSSTPQYSIDSVNDDESYDSLPQFPCGESGCSSLFNSIYEYEIHFRTAHRIVCSECKKSFPTYNLLDVHLQEKHDNYHKAAEERNLAKFECFVEGCSCAYFSAEERDSHVVADHNYPPNFKFQFLKTKHNAEAMEVTQDSELSTDHVVKRKKSAVPTRICFGRGSLRTFAPNPRKKVIKDISMKELADAL